MKSMFFKLRYTVLLPIFAVLISTSFLSGCSKGGKGGSNPPPANAPGQPVIVAITSPSADTVTVDWSTSGDPGAYWLLKNQDTVLYKSPVHDSDDMTNDEESVGGMTPGNYNFVVSLCNTADVCTDSESTPFTLGTLPGNITAQIQEKNGDLSVQWSIASGSPGARWMVLDNNDQVRPFYSTTQFDATPVSGAVQSASTHFLIHNGSYHLSVMVCNGQGNSQICSQSTTQTLSVTDSNTQPSFFMGYFPSAADSFYNAFTNNNTVAKSPSDIQAISLLAGGIPNYITQMVLSYATPNQLHQYTALSHTPGDLSKIGLAFKSDSASVQQAVAALRQKNPGIEVLLAVGGADNNKNWAGFSDADATGLAQLVKDLGLDGVYIDYQVSGTSTDDINAYYTVISKIRAQLNTIPAPKTVAAKASSLKSNKNKPHKKSATVSAASASASPVLVLGGWATGADCTQAALNAGACWGATSYWTDGNAGRERLLFAAHPDVSGMISEIAVASYNSGVAHYDPLTAYSDYARTAPGIPLAIGLTQAPETSPNSDPAAILAVTGVQNQCSANQIKQNQYGQAPANGNAYSVDRFTQGLSAGDGMMLWSMFVDDTKVPACGSDQHKVTDIAQGVSKDLGIGNDTSTVINQTAANNYGVTVKWTSNSLPQQTSDTLHSLRVDLAGASPALVTTYQNGAPISDTYQFATTTTGWSIDTDGHTLVSAAPITTAQNVTVALTAQSLTADPGAPAQGGSNGTQQNVSFKVVISSPAMTWNTQAVIPNQSSNAAAPIQVSLNGLSLISTAGVPGDTYDFSIVSGGAGWHIGADKQTLTSNNIILDPQTVTNLVLQAQSRTTKGVSSNSPAYTFTVSVPYAVKWTGNPIPTQPSTGTSMSIDLSAISPALAATYQNGASVQDSYQFTSQSGTDSGWSANGQFLTGPVINAATQVTVVLKATSTTVKPGLAAQNGNVSSDPTEQKYTFTVNAPVPTWKSGAQAALNFDSVVGTNGGAGGNPTDLSTLINGNTAGTNLQFALNNQGATQLGHWQIAPCTTASGPNRCLARNWSTQAPFGPDQTDKGKQITVPIYAKNDQNTSWTLVQGGALPVTVNSAVNSTPVPKNIVYDVGTAGQIKVSWNLPAYQAGANVIGSLWFINMDGSTIATNQNDADLYATFDTPPDFTKNIESFGQTTKATLTGVTSGPHTLYVSLCNSSNNCVSSDATEVTVSGGLWDSAKIPPATQPQSIPFDAVAGANGVLNLAAYTTGGQTNPHYGIVSATAKSPGDDTASWAISGSSLVRAYGPSAKNMGPVDVKIQLVTDQVPTGAVADFYMNVTNNPQTPSQPIVTANSVQLDGAYRLTLSWTTPVNGLIGGYWEVDNAATNKPVVTSAVYPNYANTVGHADSNTTMAFSQAGGVGTTTVGAQTLSYSPLDLSSLTPNNTYNLYIKLCNYNADGSLNTSSCVNSNSFPVQISPLPPSNGQVIGYLQTYGRKNPDGKTTWVPPSADALKGAGYTQVNLAFVLFTQNDPSALIPTFSVDDPWQSGNPKDSWRDYIQNLRKAGIKVLFSIGGASCDTKAYPNCTYQFNQSVTSLDDADKMATAIVNLINDPTYGGFDGVDVDIESGLNANGSFGSGGDIGNLAEVVNQVRAKGPKLIITYAPQMANVAPTASYQNNGRGIYSSLIMQTCGNVDRVGVQLYNGASDYSINTTQTGSNTNPPACGLIDELNNMSTNAGVSLATGLLENWGNRCNAGGQLLPYTNSNGGKTCLAPSQVILGYLSTDSTGGMDGGGPPANISNIKNTLLCLRTGGAAGCTPGTGSDAANVNNPISPLGKYNIGGVFDWDIYHDQNNNFAFAKGLSDCVQNASGDSSACMLTPKPVITNASVDYSTPGAAPASVSFTATVQPNQGLGTKWSVLSDGVVVTGASNLTPINTGSPVNTQSGVIGNLILSITQGGPPHSIVVKLCDNQNNCSVSDAVSLAVNDNGQPRLGSPTIDTLAQGTGSNNTTVNLAWHADLTSPQIQANKWSVWENGAKVGNKDFGFDTDTPSQQSGHTTITGLAIGSTHTYIVQLCSNNSSISCTNSPSKTVTLVNVPPKPVLISGQPNYNYTPAASPTDTVSVQVGWYASGTGTNWFVLADGEIKYSSASYQGGYASGTANVNLMNGAHTVSVALCNSANYVQDPSVCTLSDPFSMRVGPDFNNPPAPVSVLGFYYFGQSTIDVSKTRYLTSSFQFYTPANKPTAQSNTAQLWNVVIYASSPVSPSLVSPDYTIFGTNTGFQQDGKTIDPSSGSGGAVLDISTLTNGKYYAIVQLCNVSDAQHGSQRQCINSGMSGAATQPISFTVTGGAAYPTPNPSSLTMAPLSFTDPQQRTVDVKLDAEWTSGTVTKGSYWKLTDDYNSAQSVMTNNTFGASDGPNQQTTDIAVGLTGVGDHLLTAYLCNGNPGVQDVCSVQKGSGTVTLPPLPTPGSPVINTATTNTPQNGKLATLAWAVGGSSPVGGSNWQLRDSTSATDISNSTLVASYTFNTGNPGTSDSVNNVLIPDGDHNLFIHLCNADSTCTDGPTKAVTTSGAPLKRTIGAYYSNWGTYNTYLRHGAVPSTVTPSDSYGDAPYGFSGVQYQDRANAFHKMGQNADTDSEVKNLDIIYYAFVEAYPANSVTWDTQKCQWFKSPADYPYDPTQPTDPQYKNLGNIFFFDPWADVYADMNTNAVDPMCNATNVAADTPANPSAPNYPEGPLHVLCLGGYETGAQFTKKANEGTQLTIPIPTDTINSSSYPWYFRFGNFTQFVKQQNRCDGTDPNCTPLKHVISVGGWAHEDAFDTGAFVGSDGSGSVNGAQNFANSIVKLMNLVSSTIKMPNGTPASVDGVDLDYEPNLKCGDKLIRYTPESAVKLINVAKTLRTTFDSAFPKDHKLVTTAVFANPNELSIFDNNQGDCSQEGQCNLRKYAAQLDYINVMGYDYHGPWDALDAPAPALSQSNLYTNGVDNYSTHAAVTTLLNAGVPANKIIVGIPSYARVDSGVAEGDSHGLNQQISKQNYPDINGNAVSNPIYIGDLDSPATPDKAQGQESYYSIMLPTKGWNPTNKSNYTANPWLGNFGFDAGTGKNPYTANDSSTGVLSQTWLYSTQSPPNNSGNNKAIPGTDKGTFATYDTAALVATKADYVMSNGLGGMMMWEMISDTPPNKDNADANTNSLLCIMYQKLHMVSQCQY
jgi:GH18 family chitinase